MRVCVCICVRTHTHTHTHTYIYIYIYIYKTVFNPVNLELGTIPSGTISIFKYRILVLSNPRSMQIKSTEQIIFSK